MLLRFCLTYIPEVIANNTAVVATQWCVFVSATTK